MNVDRRKIILPVIIALMLLPIYQAHGQNFVEYNVQLNGDGSAAWRIIQVSDINAPIDSWAEFQQKTLNLVDSAANVSHREMAVDFDSMQIDTSISAESKTTEYVFTWQNFSVVQSQQITAGDAFRVGNFFGKLYGDASLKIAFASGFTVKAASPQPSEVDNQTLIWYRTQDFINGNPSIILTNGIANGGSSGNWLLPISLGVAVIILAVVAVGIFLRRRSKAKRSARSLAAVTLAVETEEDKVLKTIKSSGGTIRQSEIIEQLKFSKAKTSQLLAVLEQKGLVSRIKKGRDKIVSLNNEK